MGKQLGSTLDIPQVATPTANPAAARQLVYAKSDGKVYTKNSAGTETLVGPSTAGALGEYTALAVGGTGTWMRLATLDGVGTSQGASFTAIISGYGNFGSAHRGTTFLHVGQRGDNAYAARAWNFNNGSTSVPQVYHVKQISTWVFEVWVNRSAFDAAFGMQVLSKWGTTVNFDSESTTMPGGTLTPVSNLDLALELALKEAMVSAGSTAQYYRGDKTWQTLNAAAVANAMSLDTQQTITGLKLFQARLRSGFNTNVVQTPLTTSAAEFELSSNSMITIGESVAADANPAITFYRTTAGNRIGIGLREVFTAALGPFKWQVGSSVAYGTETWTDIMSLTTAGALGVNTVNVVTLNLTNPITQAKTHASPDTDSATTALHHTLGTGAFQAAAGNHGHLLTDAGITGTLAQSKGGTGQTAFNFPFGLIYQSGSGAFMVSSPTGTAGQALISGGAAAAPVWQSLMLSDIPDAWVKRSVKAASLPPSGNVVIATGGPLTVDGISVVAGDRVLLKDQTITSQNGIYQVNAGAWTRVLDGDTASEIAGGTVNIDQGTQAGQMWTTTFKPTDTLGSTAMSWYRLLDTSMLGVVGGAANFTHTHTVGQVTGAASTATTVTGALGLSGGGDLSANRQIVVDAANYGLTHAPVDAATTTNITLSGLQGGGLDGAVITAGSRVLVKNQTTSSENGIYVVAAGAWSRAPDANSILGCQRGNQVYVNTSSAQNGGKTFTQTLLILTVGTDGQNWVDLIHVETTVVAVSTTNIATLSGGVTVDDVALAAGTRVLLTGQTTTSQNGIWLVQSGAWTRPADVPVAHLTSGGEVFVMGGTLYAGSIFIQTLAMSAIGIDAQVWVRLLDERRIGAANGVAGLDASTKVPLAQLGTGTPSGATFLRGDNTWAVPAGGGGGGSSTPAAYAGRYLAGTQNIPAGAVTTVLWDTQTATPVGIGYNATTGEFTVTADGVYTIAASCAWPINTTGNARSTILLVNGTTRAQTGLPPSALSTTGMGVEAVHTLSLTAGDKISVQVYQNSTANPLALYPSEAFTRIAITANGAGSSSTATPLAMGKYTNTGVQSIPDATWTRITGLTTIWLDGGATRTTDYIVVPVTGRYAIAGYLGWASSPSGSAFRRIVGIGRNWTIATPSSNIIGSTETPATAGQTTFPSTRYYEEFDLVAGDIICLLGYQNSGAALNTMTTTQNTMLSVRQIPMTSGGASSASGGNSLVGAATVATDSATIAAGVETLRLAASFTGQTGQQYRIKAMCVPRIDTAAGYVNPRLRWDTAGTGVTGTLLELGQTDFRVANRPESMYLESPPFTYIGTNNATLYAKLTLSFGGGIGYDNSLTIGPTWVEIEAVGPPGTAGQVTVQPRMRATKTANWTTPLATWNLVTGWTTAYDTYAAFDGTYYTVPVDGTYFVSAASGEIATNSAGRRVLNIEIGGPGVNPGVGTIIIGAESMSATSPVNLTAATDVYLTAGQQIRVCLFNSAAVNQTVTATARPSIFTIRKVEA